MNKLMLATFATVFSTAVLADNVVITTTKSWTPVPITVDAEKKTYTTVETKMPEGDYYFTYLGHRCLRDKIATFDGEVVIYHSGTPGGADIYCYPETIPE